MYSVLASAVNHPDTLNRYYGLFNRRILRAVAESGVDVDVVSPRPFAPPIGPYSAYASLPQTEAWGAYTVHHPRFLYLLPKRFFYGLAGESFSRRVPPYLDRELDVPDVVHACHVYLDGYGMLPYVREHELPLFVVAHGTILNTYETLPRAVRRNVRETLDEATGVLCVSNALADRARELTDSDTVSTVPLGADPDRFPVGRREQIRRELDIDEDATVVLFVGQFTEAKGVREILEVLPRIDDPDVTFVFVGHGGGLSDELRDTLATAGRSPRLVFDGLPPLALRRWFAIADLLWLPSHTEGRPTVIYEAMASETAVLASSVGGVPEQVVDGETGVLVGPRDPDGLEAGLRSLLGDPTRLREMGVRGKQRLLERGWTWDEHAKRVRKLHREALE
ncbi:glycosyltransferase [Halorubrum sp. DTA46]|uniref:glycosyltransferase n=1 Tax=Halorubrum sp. DTA46 TaxID=3402162 RepID=UPI003AAC7069